MKNKIKKDNKKVNQQQKHVYSIENKFFDNISTWYINEYIATNSDFTTHAHITHTRRPSIYVHEFLITDRDSLSVTFVDRARRCACVSELHVDFLFSGK